MRRWAWPAAAGPTPDAPAGESDLARLTRAVDAHARDVGARSAHRPWRPPLPDRITVADARDGSAGADRSATRLRMGLIDLPDSQTQRPLELDLDDGGTWLVVGGPRSGRSTLLRTVLREAVSQLGADDLHVHVVESGGGQLAAETAGLPHAGTVISGEDRLRTVRLVERLSQEIATRRARTGAAGLPRLLLLVDGMEELSTVIEEADPGHGATTLTRLLRDGRAAGLTCVVTADRAVPGGQLAGLARHRLVLPLADRADYAVAGVPPRAVPGHRPPGRALLGEEALECQLALPRPPGDVVRTPATPGNGPAADSRAHRRIRCAAHGRPGRNRRETTTRWCWSSDRAVTRDTRAPSICPGPAGCSSRDRRGAAAPPRWMPSPVICTSAGPDCCGSDIDRGPTPSVYLTRSG